MNVNKIAKQSSYIVALVAGLVATALLFQTAFVETWKAWQTEEYSHGYLVPIIAVLMLLYKARGVSAPRQNSWLGFLAALFCIIFLFLFEIAGIRGIQPLLLVAFLYAVFLTIFGLRYSLAMAAPLGFLLFLVPLPKFLYYQLSFNMQMISTDLSVLMLQASNITVFQEGNIIDLGIMKMEVAEACNGLRYLFPLMALGYLMAFMYKAAFWKKVVLFVSTVPITIALNSVRIFLIGVSANVWGPDVAAGIVHDVEGWVIFLACFLVLVMEILLLQKIGRRGEFDFDCLGLPSKESWQRLTHVEWRLPFKSLIVALVLAVSLFSFAGAKGWGDIKPVPLAKPFSEFPMQIGTWVGRPNVMDAASLSVLGTDDYLLADYRKLTGESVNLYILYYPQQDSTSNQAVHSPEVCIPGGGWVIQSHTQKTVTVASGNIQPVNRLIITKGMERQLVYYWFFQGDTMTADALYTRVSIIARTLGLGQSNGGMVRLVTSVGKNETMDEADERLQVFLRLANQDIAKWVYQ